MEIKPEHSQRLEDALEEADNQFWAAIANRFPEAKTGDYPPDLTFTRDQHNKESVLWWLRFNAPKLIVGGEEEEEEEKRMATLPLGVYESGYGNAIAWDGYTAYDLDMGENVPFNVILKDRYIRPLD